MGNQPVSDNANKKNTNFDGKINDIITFDNAKESSYKGVITEFDNTSEKFDETSVSTAKENESHNEKKKTVKNNDFVEFQFIWDEEGKECYVTGSFVDWGQRVKLEFKEKNVHTAVLSLPRDKHSFKFIIDNAWKTSKRYSVSRDENGNDNNYVDLQYYSPINKEKAESPKKSSKKESDKDKGNDKTTDKTDKSDKEKKVKKKNEILNFDKEKENLYSRNYPDRTSLKTIAPIIPVCYFDIFNINDYSNQLSIGNKSYLNLERKLIYKNSNCSVDSISTPPHIYM